MCIRDRTNYYEEQLDRMAQLTEGTERPLVYLAGNSSYLTAAPDAMYQSSLIEGAGGTNVCLLYTSFTLDVYGHVSERMKEDSASRMQQYIEGFH